MAFLILLSFFLSVAFGTTILYQKWKYSYYDFWMQKKKYRGNRNDRFE
jgi:hypothetical protein